MAISIKDSIDGAFGRHETFTIRYGWLKRGFDHAVADPSLFYSDDAHHRLGVGKNMAKSIRFWLSAARLMEEVPAVDNSRRTVMVPTYFGLALLNGRATVDTTRYELGLSQVAPAFVGVEGFDPFLERLESWWLIHWMMLSPHSRLPVWWTAFNTFGAVSFTPEVLLDHVLAQIEATAAWNSPRPPSQSTVKKDVLALLRAYAGTLGSRKADKLDDTIDAPMVPLSLVRAAGSGFRFAVGRKPGMSPAVVAFACLDFLDRTGFTARSALISSLANEVGGPGKAFKLAERDLVEMLQEAAAEQPNLIAVSSTASSPTLVTVSEGGLRTVASKLLARHYGSPTYTDETVTELNATVSSDIVPALDGGQNGSTDQGKGSVRAVSQTRLF
ncbi:DUF4007 family protein [Hoyosella subflava]|uniref:DUF4007 domain-containing protein n=1 Tax=Hoyosella subflava (strain DSM 45089 / JCM 17490 / NBRC 109087 / DQS3-9A1) TaxID=443218 RepID=F6EJ47_HOYSD|nr:DUF4007 family protein [Hoyosella subflava]AEF41279.1 hypothetical protein AS9A_2832 [Hoyosella subflava DQS3-9A1]